MVQDASAFLDQELDKLENALISKRLPSDEVALSSGVGRQFAQIAMGLLEQEPGFRAAEGEPLIPFNEEQCYRTIRLFLAGITHASIKAWQYQITGEPKSVILQSLAQDVFAQAKQVVASTVGQELTPEIAFSEQQQLQWVYQATDGALSHYWQQYEREFGRISHQASAKESASALATFQTQQQEQQQALYSSEVTVPPDEQPLADHVAIPPMASEHIGESASSVVYTATPSPQAPSVQEKLLTKLAALGLFLTTQAPANQQAWLQKFPPDQQQWIVHYMNPHAVMQERPMKAVVEALNALTQSIQHQKQQPSFQQQHVQHQLQGLLQQQGWYSLEGLLQTERPAVKAYLHALATNKPVKTAAFSVSLQQSMLQYFQTILGEG